MFSNKTGQSITMNQIVLIVIAVLAMFGGIASANTILTTGAETGDLEACRLNVAAIKQFENSQLGAVIDGPIEYRCPVRHDVIELSGRASTATKNAIIEAGTKTNDCSYQFLDGEIPELKSTVWGTWSFARAYECERFYIEKSDKYTVTSTDEAKAIWASHNTWGTPLKSEQTSILSYVTNNGFLEFEGMDTFQEGISYSILYVDFPESNTLVQRFVQTGGSPAGSIVWHIIDSANDGEHKNNYPDGILITPTRLVENNQIKWLKIAPENMIITREVT